MMRSLTRLFASVGSALLAAAVLAGVPAGLVAYVGWPLPTTWPQIDTLGALTQIGVSDTVMINTLAIIVWLAWAQLTIAFLTELAAAVRRQTSRPLPVLPGLQPLAGRLVAAIMLASVATQPRVALAGSPLGATLTTVTATAGYQTAEPATPAVEEERQPTPSTTTVRTGERDSWWQLAEQHLGDGLRWREIRDLNLNRTVSDGTRITATTEQLEPGWSLLVPAKDDNAATRQPDRSRTVDPEETEETVDAHETADLEAPAVWQVAPGEHFWTIAQQTLATAWQRPPDDNEITPYWQELVEHNRDQLAPPHDPDLIHPGQHFNLPPIPADPTATPVHRTPERQANGSAPETNQPDAQQIPADDDPATPGNPEGSDVRFDHLQDLQSPAAADPPEASSSEHQSGLEGTAAVPRDPIGRQDAVQPPPASPDPVDAEQLDTETSTTSFGQHVPGGLAPGVAAAALAASGILALLRRRRRATLQKGLAGLRLPTPAKETTAQVGRLEAVAPPERTLDEFGLLLSSIPTGLHPVLVTVNGRTVTLLFDDTADPPTPPSPWHLHHDGTTGPISWRAEIGTQGPSRSFGLPLLVTLGQTAAGTVLANLGAMGTLSVTGGQNEIRRVLRTISLELATSRTSGPIEVVVAGDELFDTVEDLRHVDDPGAELAAAIAERDEGAIIDDRLPRLLVCHHDVVPPTLPDQGLDGLVGVITAAPEQVSRWQLEVTDTEHAQLRLPDGVQLKLVLPDLTPEVIADELDRLASPVADPDAPVPPDEAVGTDRADPVAAVADQSSNGQHPAGAIPAPASELLPSWLDVHLLGPVRVLRDGAPVEDLTPLTLQLLLYLVTHREGITAERLDEAIWAGQLAPPTSQRLRSGLTKLRETLGTGPDGETLVPRRRTATCHVALSEHVGSDLDRAFAHLARARDLSSDAQFNEYAAALDLVRGEPFEGLPLSWASPVSERAIVELQNAALVAAAGYRQAGHLDQADQVIQQGLKLSDPCEPLYLEWARLEAARGRYGQVRQIRRQLRARYNDEADEVAGWVNTLSPETELVFKKLAQGE